MSVMSQCYSIIIDLGISATAHGKEVVGRLNDVYKRYIYQSMSTVELPGSIRFDTQMQIHTGNQKYDVSLAKEFQHRLTKEYCKNCVFDQGKKKRFIGGEWTDRQYCVQDNTAVAHQDARLYCNRNQFPALPFCGPHSKLHGTRGLSKQYHLSFDPKIGHSICVICHIPCVCVSCR